MFNLKPFKILGDTIYSYDIDYEIAKGKDGKDHWKIKKNQISYSPEYVSFNFENLFNGNKELCKYQIRIKYIKNIILKLIYHVL